MLRTVPDAMMISSEEDRFGGREMLDSIVDSLLRTVPDALPRFGGREKLGSIVDSLLKTVPDALPRFGGREKLGSIVDLPKEELLEKNSGFLPGRGHIGLVTTGICGGAIQTGWDTGIKAEVLPGVN